MLKMTYTTKKARRFSRFRRGRERIGSVWIGKTYGKDESDFHDDLGEGSDHHEVEDRQKPDRNHEKEGERAGFSPIHDDRHSLSTILWLGSSEKIRKVSSQSSSSDQSQQIRGRRVEGDGASSIALTQTSVQTSLLDPGVKSDTYNHHPGDRTSNCV
jgi:hypothetical protein